VDARVAVGLEHDKFLESRAFTMQNKITNSSTPSAEDLKRVFEAGVCPLGVNDAAKQRVPIFTRVGGPDAEKRALADAARALAQLWKISPHPARLSRHDSYGNNFPALKK
jgi:hypothetical protein